MKKNEKNQFVIADNLGHSIAILIFSCIGEKPVTQPQSRKTSASKVGGIMGPSSILTLTVPVVALIVALLSRSLLLLTYVHVLTGGTWTGIDLFMGLVMSRVLGDLSTQSRVEVIKKLVPIMLFFMPALASVAITAGVYLAISLGWNFLSTPIIAAFHHRGHLVGPRLCSDTAQRGSRLSRA